MDGIHRSTELLESKGFVSVDALPLQLFFSPDLS
jgi:hypothetical protein